MTHARTARSTSAQGSADESEPPTLLYVIKQIDLALRSRLDEILRPAGITATQYTALSVLERHVGLTSAQLARTSSVTAQSMADLVTALQDAALVKRHRDAADRRRLVLSLTAKGRRVLVKYRPKVDELEAEMVGALSDRQRGELRRGLLSCRTSLDVGPPV